MRPVPLASSCLLFALAGCGGGGSKSDDGKSRVTIEWPSTTSRAFEGSAIAGSARIVLQTTAQAPVTVADVPVVRPSGTSKVERTYALPDRVAAGSYLLTVRFCAGASADLANEVGLGTIVATVGRDGKLRNSDGEPLRDVSFSNSLTGIAVTAGQTVRVGQKTSLLVSATSPGGGVVAIPYGQLSFTVASGGALQANDDGTVTGARVGTSSVVARFLGLQSAPASVAVTAE